MKKLIALFLILALALCAAACSPGQKKDASSQPAPAAPTRSGATLPPLVTEAPAAPTAPATPFTPATEAPTEPEEPTAGPGSFFHEDKNGLWRVTVPDIWKEIGMLVEYEDGYTGFTQFVYKTAYYEGAGHVFTIATCYNPADFVDVEQLPHAEELYHSPDVQVYAMYPTDVQFGIYDDPSSDAFKKQMEEYNELNDTRKGIIDSFTWIA